MSTIRVMALLTFSNVLISSEGNLVFIKDHLKIYEEHNHYYDKGSFKIKIMSSKTNLFSHAFKPKGLKHLDSSTHY